MSCINFANNKVNKPIIDKQDLLILAMFTYQNSIRSIFPFPKLFKELTMFVSNTYLSMLILQNTGFNARKLGKFNKLYPAVKLYITRHIFLIEEKGT